jgi:hypothetical protein
VQAGKRRLAGDTARAATSSEVKDLRQEARALKEVRMLQGWHNLRTMPLRGPALPQPGGTIWEAARRSEVR